MKIAIKIHCYLGPKERTACFGQLNLQCMSPHARIVYMLRVQALFDEVDHRVRLPYTNNARSNERQGWIKLGPGHRRSRGSWRGLPLMKMNVHICVDGFVSGTLTSA